MVFDDWKEKSCDRDVINSALLWDYDLENFDWLKWKVIVVQRVIERGRPEDFYIAIQKYGGLEAFIQIIKEIPYLNAVDMNYVHKAFNIELNELKCYKNKLHRKELLDYWNN